RRRHTRFSRDWSSDVCSSDLLARKNNYVFLPLHEIAERALPEHFSVPEVVDDSTTLAGTKRDSLEATAELTELHAALLAVRARGGHHATAKRGEVEPDSDCLIGTRCDLELTGFHRQA